MGDFRGLLGKLEYLQQVILHVPFGMMFRRLLHVLQGQQQHAKEGVRIDVHLLAFQIALEIDPRITAEDLWNPQDVPAIANDARWNYEDGILAGWLAAQMALRARMRETR